MPAKPTPTPPPPAPPETNGGELPEPHADLEQFVDGLRLRHFSAREFTPCWTRERGGVTNCCPSETLWPNIVPTLVVLDELREEIGQPITLLSTYRSPRYNAAMDGEPNSYHLRFMACDFTAGCGASALHAACREMRGRLFRMPGNGSPFRWDGGLGLYVKSNFVHLDCRSTPANWRGN